MDISAEDYLEHFGVRGMKWGVRKGRRKTGMSRTRGAILDRNERLKYQIGKAQRGEKFKISMAIGKAFVGKEQQKANQDMMIKNLNRQSARIKSGKITVADRIEFFSTTAISDLVVSRTPKNPNTRRAARA